MPNLMLHCSGNLGFVTDLQTLTAVNKVVNESGLFDEQDIKTRGLVYDHFVVGTDSESRGFLHLMVAMSARPEHVEKSLSESLVEVLQQAVAGVKDMGIQICVEITHVNTATYVKRMQG